MTISRSRDVHHPLALIAQDPAAAQNHAEDVLSGRPDPETRSTALRLLGMARRELGDTAAAHRLLRQAAAVAARAGLGEPAAHARASRLGLLALRGGGGMAGTSLARLVAGTPSAQPLVLFHRGIAAAQQGRFGAATAQFDAAIARLVPGVDDHLLPGLLCNLGLALMYSGRLSESAEALQRALGLAEEHAFGSLRGVTLQNLGCLAVRRGDLPRAVAHFTDADGLVAESRRASLRLDHADALLVAGMVREAARLLSPLSDAGREEPAERATALLLQAKIDLARGERDSAWTRAEQVRCGFAADSLWAQLADLVQWSARHVADHGPEQGQDRARWRGPRGLLGDHGSGGAGAEETARVLARCVPSAPLGPLPLVFPAPHMAALRALAAGDHRVAYRELVRPSPGTGHPSPARHIELLAHARTPHREVAAAGAKIALGNGDAAMALEWLERRQALAPVPGPCRDSSWTGLLDRYRSAHTRISAGDQSAREELGRVAARLAAAQWHTGCTAPALPAGPGSSVATKLAERLGERAFLCYIRLPDTHAAITVVDGRTEVHALPPAAEVEDAVAKLAYSARMNVLSNAPFPEHGPAGPAALVDRLLIEPVSAAVGDRPLVIAPAPYAQALPWGLLPGMRGRAISVVPSARAWLTRAGRVGYGLHHRAMFAAGRDLEGASAEIRSLLRLHPGAVALTGPAARVPTVLRELGRADLAHLAAHGFTSAENPMLSGLLLADGPLLAYDLEQLPRMPRLAVLSSCWVGGSTPAPSGVPLGLAAALLALGSAAVVAGVLPIRDHDITAAMVGFHTALASGTAPAQAVADHLSAAGFLCLGAG